MDVVYWHTMHSFGRIDHCLSVSSVHLSFFVCLVCLQWCSFHMKSMLSAMSVLFPFLVLHPCSPSFPPQTSPGQIPSSSAYRSWPGESPHSTLSSSVTLHCTTVCRMCAIITLGRCQSHHLPVHRLLPSQNLILMRMHHILRTGSMKLRNPRTVTD